MFSQLPKKIKENFIATICVLLAIALQIQITIFSNDDYAGLRINMADAFLPVLGLIIFSSIILKKTKFPRFHIKSTILWLIAISIILASSLIHSYLNIGEWDQWALVNKTVGWLILCSYFLLGGWIAQQASDKNIYLLIKVFTYFFSGAFLLLSTFFMLRYFNILPQFTLNKHPMVGLMANKNAYTFLFLSAFVTSSCFLKSKLDRAVFYALCSSIPFFYLFTFSRTFLIMIPVIFTFLYVINHQQIHIKKALTYILLSCCIIFSLDWFQKNEVLNNKPFETLVSRNFEVLKDTKAVTKSALKGSNFDRINEQTYYAGDNLRLEVLEVALNSIKEYPILGAGLGSVIREQNHDKYIPVVVDNTVLWLWSETGLVGLSVFLVFYILCLKAFYQNGFNKNNSELTQSLNKAVFLILITFGLMSIFHELLYTRFMWFFMGLALAYPLKPLASRQN